MGEYDYNTHNRKQHPDVADSVYDTGRKRCQSILRVDPTSVKYFSVGKKSEVMDPTEKRVVSVTMLYTDPSSFGVFSPDTVSE